MKHSLPPREQTWTLPELVQAASELVDRAGAASSDDRVSALPDARTVRYYQSLGIVDRPLRYDGRTAIYGYRSLLQVVATKLLQGQGYSLAQVQGALTGVATERLEQAVSDALGGAAAPASPPPTTGPSLRVSAEVVPGVVVTVDPGVVTDPDALLSAIHLFLSRRSGGLS